MKFDGVEVLPSQYTVARLAVPFGPASAPHAFHHVVGQSIADARGHVNLLLETPEGGLKWYHILKTDARMVAAQEPAS